MIKIKRITDSKIKEAAWVEIFGKKPSKIQLRYINLFDCSKEEMEREYKGIKDTPDLPKRQTWEEAKDKFIETSKGLVYRMA